jgi:hypothetical protein
LDPFEKSAGIVFGIFDSKRRPFIICPSGKAYSPSLGMEA